MIRQLCQKFPTGLVTGGFILSAYFFQFYTSITHFLSNPNPSKPLETHSSLSYCLFVFIHFSYPSSYTTCLLPFYLSSPSSPATYMLSHSQVLSYSPELHKSIHLFPLSSAHFPNSLFSSLFSLPVFMFHISLSSLYPT